MFLYKADTKAASTFKTEKRLYGRKNPQLLIMFDCSAKKASLSYKSKGKRSPIAVT
jgi:hypothetical protein